MDSLAVAKVQKKSSVFCRKKFCHLDRTVEVRPNQMFSRSLMQIQKSQSMGFVHEKCILKCEFDVCTCGPFLGVQCVITLLHTCPEFAIFHFFYILKQDKMFKTGKKVLKQNKMLQNRIGYSKTGVLF